MRRNPLHSSLVPILLGLLLLFTTACAPEEYEAPRASLPDGVTGAADTPDAIGPEPGSVAFNTVSLGRYYMSFSATGTSLTISTTGASSDISLEIYSSENFNYILGFCDNSFKSVEESCLISGLTTGQVYGLTLTEWDGISSYAITVDTL